MYDVVMYMSVSIEVLCFNVFVELIYIYMLINVDTWCGAR